MARPTKLTAELAEEICEYARKGLPIRRAAALVGVHRVSAQRWMRQGALEIAEAADDDGELTPQAAFAIAFDAARAEFLLGLSTAWQAAIKRKDANVAKAVQVMMASQSPDEYSERRVVRTVDQKMALTGDIGVGRFAEMSDAELTGERQRIEARRAAAEAQPDDDWREAVAQRPAPAGGDIVPGPAPGEKNPEPGNPQSGSQTIKSQTRGFSGDDHALPQNISPTRARILRNSDASVEDGPVGCPDRLDRLLAT